jgi:DNA-binding GntR family transcriptional regulator
VSLVDLAYQEIRRRILDNEYPPGHQVLEFDLAAELEMSRTPVREALVRLQNENFVHLIPRHGMRVVPLSVSDLRDMYEALAALEQMAVERLARARPPDSALAPIGETVDQMERALRRQDLDGWAKADERFHRTLVRMCGNARIVAMVETLWDQGHRARMTTLRMRKNLEQSNQEHRAVVEAIRQGNWREACAVYRLHFARGAGQMLEILEQTGLARK